MKDKRIKRVWQVLMLIVVAALFVYPFWWMLVNSLNTAAQVFGKPTLLPRAWRWVNFLSQLWSGVQSISCILFPPFIPGMKLYSRKSFSPGTESRSMPLEYSGTFDNPR